MTLTNELLLILLGLAVLLLGVAGEFSAPANRTMRLVAAVLGLLVLIFALVR